MKLAFGCDHAALKLKNHLMQYAKETLGHEVEDYGCYTEESVDYPDYGEAVGNAVVSGKADRGIVICYTGIGIGIAANKVNGVRCALCHEPFSARLTREHNNTNMLSMGAGIIGEALAEDILTVWLNTEAQGGRHQKRVEKIMAIETRN